MVCAVTGMKVGSKGQLEVVDIAEMEVCGLSDDVDVEGIG